MNDPLIPTPLPRRHSPAPGTTLALIAAFADVALTVGLGVLRTTNSQFGQRRAEGLLPTFAFAIVLAAPGIVALIGVAIARPVLFGAAAIGCLPARSSRSLAVWIPAVLFMIAFARASATRSSS